MLSSLKDIEPLLRCPVLGKPLFRNGDSFQTVNGECIYPTIHGKPALFDFKRSIVSEQQLLRQGGASDILRHDSGIKSLIRSYCFQPGAVSKARQNAGLFLANLPKKTHQRRILVIGGGTIGIGSDQLMSEPDTEVVSFDVYDTPNVQFLADAHQIPLEDSCVDGVWIQYVLEHVLEPWTVANEISRVLRKDGVVYSETPFLQQVHEGAYDFVRFTHSGQRWLFKNFEEIASGEAMGQGIQLLWTVEHLARGLFRSKPAGKFTKLLFFWVQAIDRFIPPRFRLNSASSFFFLGRKSHVPLLPKYMRTYYTGVN